ncbi:DUF2840 domain-containing protein [Roseomonas sp. CECT 9278]|jgi:hypothetical protein|uniref:DUF2840 domain-containing protein n=1 Tax=Roseomonas sp. CECT 9278 TaxID=2845823 RepID=UPI001E5E4D89|nr:DUF2840 domain-containing protein [Roseomonas sp. CECT 9278]CAH0178208.1 hypothetical protein ROS9278_01372 [Roseomonas sp. CECT 9278]
MTPLTRVELLWLEGRIERWIRFGQIAEETILDRRRRVVAFAAGEVFAFVRWASNGYGTVVSRIDILRAVGPGEAFSTIGFVEPGAEILLRMSNWPKVNEVLRAIDAVERAGVAAEEACPDHWRHVMNRLAAGDQPRAYTRERHRAWLMRRRIDA